MRFWKQIGLTTLLFCAVATAIVYTTSCEPNPCNGINCLNGGSCNAGICRCPTGFENTRCQTRSSARWLGTYVGYLECNNGAQIYDTAIITEDGVPNYVKINLKSEWKANNQKVLRGYIDKNDATYSVVITNFDSTKANAVYYRKMWDVTLQSDTKLIIHSYETLRLQTLEGVDTSESKCYFLGFKKI
jgi:hypothetical protein